MKSSIVSKMKFYMCLTLGCMCIVVAPFASAADVRPSPIDCKVVQSSPVAKLDQRIDIAAHGFSVLPPQGERWCYRLLASSGVSFSKIPRLEWPSERPPSREEFVAEIG